MTRLDRLVKYNSVIVGLTSAAFFGFDAFVFSKLYPKMIRFEPVPSAEEELINWVGIGWVIFLAFCVISLYRIAWHIRKANKITTTSLLLVAMGVLSLLFIFSDVALIGDIGKQYKHGLAQPEWSILFFLSGFQFLTAVVFTYLHMFGLKEESRVGHIARDANIFVIVQYVGIICGMVGLVFSSLGFLYQRAWNLQVHTTATLIILLIPYGLAVIYWAITKIQEKPRQWYDEKQTQDVGRSAYLTLVLSVFFMMGLFIANYNQLDGVVRMLWFPMFLYFVLLLFSTGNLYLSGKE